MNDNEEGWFVIYMIIAMETLLDKGLCYIGHSFKFEFRKKVHLYDYRSWVRCGKVGRLRCRSVKVLELTNPRFLIIGRYWGTKKDAYRIEQEYIQSQPCVNRKKMDGWDEYRRNYSREFNYKLYQNNPVYRVKKNQKNTHYNNKNKAKIKAHQSMIGECSSCGKLLKRMNFYYHRKNICVGDAAWKPSIKIKAEI